MNRSNAPDERPAAWTPPTDEQKQKVAAMPGTKPNFLPNEVTLTEARELVRMSIGPRGRIWKEDGGYRVGVDMLPGRRSLSFAETLHEALNRAFDPHWQDFGAAPPKPAPVTTP